MLLGRLAARLLMRWTGAVFGGSLVRGLEDLHAEILHVIVAAADMLGAKRAALDWVSFRKKLLA